MANPASGACVDSSLPISGFTESILCRSFLLYKQLIANTS